MPLGALLDQWEVYRQFNSLSRSNEEKYIDELLDTSL